MKKVLVASILGIALSVTSSYGNGYIIMQNYDVVGSTPVYSGITYGPGWGAKSGKFIGSGFSVDLLYSLDGGATYSLAAGSQTSMFPNSKDGGSPTTDGAGTFFGPDVTIPGYTSGSVDFIVQAFNGTAYGSPTSTAEGQSAPFVINSLQSNPLIPPDDLLQLNGGATPTGLQPFIIPAPEPSTYSLGALAGALMIFRLRKQVSLFQKQPQP